MFGKVLEKRTMFANTREQCSRTFLKCPEQKFKSEGFGSLTPLVEEIELIFQICTSLHPSLQLHLHLIDQPPPRRNTSWCGVFVASLCTVSTIPFQLTCTMNIYMF